VAELSGHEGTIASVVWNPAQPTILASCSDDKRIYVWDTQEKKRVASLIGHTNQVLSVKWSPDGKLLASGSWDGTVKIWNHETQENLYTFTAHESPVKFVEWSPDGKTLVSFAEDGIVRTWSPFESVSPVSVRSLSHGWMQDAHWSPDGRQLACAGDDGIVAIYEDESKKLVRELKGHEGRICAIAWKPDGRMLASGSDDETARIWDVATGVELRTLSRTQRRGWIMDIEWSPDGKLLATGAPLIDQVLFYDAENGEIQKSVVGAPCTAVAWAPDQKMVAFTALHIVSVYNVEEKLDDETLILLKGHKYGTAIWGLSWSPDGSKLASASDDTTIRIWDPRQRESVRILRGHIAGVKGVAWSPDGTTLATASLDKTIRLWRSDTGECFAVLKGHESGVRTVQWHPDGRRIVSAGEDGTARIFITSFEDELKVARNQIQRSLSEEQKATVLQLVRFSSN
jgi:WD40 repeat protein